MAGLTRGALNTISRVATFRRLISYRKNCKLMDKPKCNLANIQQSSCYKDIVEGRVLPDHPLGQLWDNPACCNETCKDAYSRFDDLYYFISDKAKRKYTRTWNECPKMIRCKRVCCYDGKERTPPFKKRPKTHVVDTACPATPDCMALTGKACAKIKSPGCKAVRAGNVHCKKFIRPPCEKFCTPYPSFSECLKELPKKTKGNEECACTTEPMRCELVSLDAPVRLQRCSKP